MNLWDLSVWRRTHPINSQSMAGRFGQKKLSIYIFSPISIDTDI